MGLFKCIVSNSFDGVQGYEAGTIYTFASNPATNLFEVVTDGDARTNGSPSSELPAWKDLEGDYHVDYDVQFDKSIEVDGDTTLTDVNLDCIQFETTEDFETSEGKMCWSATEESLAVGMPGGSVNLNIGQEQFVPRRVINNTGSDMTNGQLVYISGGTGNNAYISLAKADAKTTAETTIAMLTEDVANNGRGYATTFGLVRDIDTSSYASGTVLYLDASTAGAFTDTVPTHPNYVVKIGQVFRQHATEGSVMINIEEPTCACRVAGGDDAVWDDLRFPATRVRLGALNKPDFDYTELGLLFPQNDTSEEIYVIAQMPHDWLEGSIVEPHIHYIQDSATAPTFTMEYRECNRNGAEVPAIWTTINTSDAGGTKAVYDYTSGSILQRAEFPQIDMTGCLISSIIDIIVYRNDNDVTGDVLVKEFDIHYQKDSLGSRQEDAKG